MSGGPRLSSTNLGGDYDSRSVLANASNKVRTAGFARKPLMNPLSKGEKTGVEGSMEVNRIPSDLKKKKKKRIPCQEMKSRCNLSLNVSCSSDCSMESWRSRASTGMIERGASLRGRRTHGLMRREKIEKIASSVPDCIPRAMPEVIEEKRRCPWITANSEPCYAKFHDEEWGVPVHDDKRLFELFVLCGALSELTWPAILSKRHLFRETFMDFDINAVSKINIKKISAPGNVATSLLSEPKFRAIIGNAHQVLKIIDEFGSFDRYCWNFVNHEPIVGHFQYARQVPAKIPKADSMSKDLVRRGFRCVGPTVIYSFMQVCGMTNDHLISCYRFKECGLSRSTVAVADGICSNGNHEEINHAVEDSSCSMTNFDASVDVKNMNADIVLPIIVDNPDIMEECENINVSVVWSISVDDLNIL